ncbi:hypothetical protein ATG_17440 [Desulfurococcaceae archaeon AG1]|nr:hypothetical protein ATG_17440 [Desulfurococcaceae archaeon AG1]
MEKKEIDEEGLSVGRILGATARWGSQQIIAELRSLAKRKKKKTYEILAEAIELYKMLDEIEHVDPKHLVIATMFLERQLELAIKLVASASSLFTSELVQSIMQTYQQLDSARQQIQIQQQTQSTPIPDIKSMVLPYVMNILQQILASITSVRPPTQQGMPQVKVIE